MIKEALFYYILLQNVDIYILKKRSYNGVLNLSRRYRFRWVEGDTPTSKDVESDRAVSVEIQQVLGIDNVPYTPPQLQRLVYKT